VVRGDRQVNELELEVDECCISLLARRAPVAGDLRLVIGVIKAVTDLERMGDEAVRIARMALRTAERGGAGSRVGDLRHMGPRVQAMVRNALDAFTRTDAQAAVNVMQEDRGVDREYESLSREMITFMMEDPRAIPLGLDVMFAARALERIGDRACNLCEYVIYIDKGTDVRHAPIEIVRNTARAD
jgi:phosphate transport system protein